jgi:hypothetical protein
MTDHIIRAHREGQSLRQIAAALGVTATTVHRILCRHGEPRRGVGYQPRPPTPTQLERDRAVILSYQSRSVRERYLPRAGHQHLRASAYALARASS